MDEREITMEIVHCVMDDPDEISPDAFGLLYSKVIDLRGQFVRVVCAVDDTRVPDFIKTMYLEKA